MSTRRDDLTDATHDGMRLERRDFLKASALLSGSLVIGLTLPIPARLATAAPAAAGGAPNAWLRIGGDSSITILVDRSEMGQGVYTALPMLIAEELEVPLSSVLVESAPPGDVYINQLLGTQMTGGSTSVRDAWEKLRKAGAQARTMLVTAAAQRLAVDAATLSVRDGHVITAGGKRLSYGELAADASRLPLPSDVKLKSADAFKLIGKPHSRVDTASKVDGSAKFGIDVKLPGMLHASIAQPPVLGGKVKSFDAAAAEKLPGVRKVVATSSGVAVIADHYWQARQAREALRVEWEAGKNATLDTAAVRATLEGSAGRAGRSARKDGDVEAVFAKGGRRHEAAYDLPLLAHATLEPMNCTADVRADGCDVYVGTQVQIIAQGAAAKAAGLDPKQVRVHTTLLGGGFGRRLEVDFIPAAVETSKAVGRPVKVIWTREDDMTHDAYRPPAHDIATAAFDDQGALQAFKLRLVSPSITARMFPSVVEAMVDPFAVEAAQNYLYDVPNVSVEFTQQEVGIDVGYWRSVSHALNCFVVESFMDELAHAAGKDPYEFRRALLGKQPRAQRVLEEAARRANWGKAPAGRHQGIAVMEGYGSYLAQVAEVSVGSKGELQVHRIVCVADCGQMVNPRIVESQVESGIVFGLTAALWGEITLDGGRVQETNFHQYRLLRLNEAPVMDVHLVASSAAPGGMGEPSTALVAPAVANAIFAATGKRVRALPFAKQPGLSA